jgi:hypothetical protein
LWRHNTAGDLPGEDNVIDITKLFSLVNANKEAKALGFTYTHKPVGWTGYESKNAEAILASNINGFTINLSADNLREADELVKYNIGPVVTIMPSNAPRIQRTPEKRYVIVCPAEDAKITCDCCGLCAKVERKSIIGFRAHGNKKKLIDDKLNDKQYLPMEM